MGSTGSGMVRYQLRNFSKTSKRPRRSYDKERLDAELKLIGTYGLKNKREIWRIGLVLSKVRAVARQLLTLEERDPQRVFQGQALMRRMIRYGILDEDKQRLDYVLALKIEAFMVRVESQPHIDFALSSPFGGGRPGRVKRKSAGGAGGDEDDE